MKNVKTFEQFVNESIVNEGKLDDLKQSLHLETNKAKAKKLKVTIGKMFQERTPAEQEDTGNHVLKKYRQDIGGFIQGSFETSQYEKYNDSIVFGPWRNAWRA